MAHLPTSRSFTPTANQLRQDSRFTRNFVVDKPIVTVFSFPSIETDDNNPLESITTGNAQLIEINSSGIAGLTLNADNEAYNFLVPLPVDMDPDAAVDFRVLASNSEAAATGSYQFIMTYGTLTAGTTALAAVTTVLSTPFTDQVDAAAEVVQWSPWGTIAAGTLSSLVPGDDLLACDIKVDLTTAANATVFMGQMRYSRRFL